MIFLILFIQLHKIYLPQLDCYFTRAKIVLKKGLNYIKLFTLVLRLSTVYKFDTYQGSNFMFKRRKLEKAYIKFVTENHTNLYRFSYSYMKNQQDALDVVQESIRKGLSSLHTLEDESVMKSWMYRIVINTSIDGIRKRKKVIMMETDDIEYHLAGVTDEYTNMDLKKAIESLPNSYRAIIMLRFFEDMKIDEIANVLEENVNTIKTRLYKALKLLKIELEE